MHYCASPSTGPSPFHLSSFMSMPQFTLVSFTPFSDHWPVGLNILSFHFYLPHSIFPLSTTFPCSSFTYYPNHLTDSTHITVSPEQACIIIQLVLTHQQYAATQSGPLVPIQGSVPNLVWASCAHLVQGLSPHPVCQQML